MNENNNMNNNVSLSSLSNGAIPTASPMGMPLPKFKSDEVKDVNKRAVALPPESERPVEGLGNPMIDQAFQNLDSTIDRLQEETNQIYEEGQEQRIEKELDEDDEISVKEDNNAYKVNNYDNNNTPSSSTYNDDDLFDEVKEEKDVVVKKLETKSYSSINTVDDDDLGLLDDDEDQEEEENRKEKEQKEQRTKRTEPT